VKITGHCQLIGCLVDLLSSKQTGEWDGWGSTRDETRSVGENVTILTLFTNRFWLLVYEKRRENTDKWKTCCSCPQHFANYLFILLMKFLLNSVQRKRFNKMIQRKRDRYYTLINCKFQKLNFSFLRYRIGRLLSQNWTSDLNYVET